MIRTILATISIYLGICAYCLFKLDWIINKDNKNGKIINDKLRFLAYIPILNIMLMVVLIRLKE